MSWMYTPIIIMTWLNCCKVLWWFYYAKTKDMVFVWLRFLFLFFESFPAFTYTNIIGRLISSLFGVKIWIPVPVFFRGINFTLSVITSYGCFCKYWSSISSSNLLYLRYLLSRLYCPSTSPAELMRFEYFLSSLSHLFGWYFSFSLIITSWWV